MYELIYDGVVYDYGGSANYGEVKLYYTKDGTKAVITDKNNRVLYSFSVDYSRQLCIYRR